MSLIAWRQSKHLAIQAVLAFCACFVGCTTVGQIEYEDFRPMPKDARIMSNVKLTWEVREDVGEYCQNSQKKRGNLLAGKPIACAIWSVSANECRVITGPNPNHLVLGHEVRHCFEGHFHP